MKLLFSGRMSAQCVEKLIPDLMKYLLASISGTLVHYCLMAALIRQFDVSVLSASTSGAITGAMIIYLLNYFCTFRSHKRHMESASRFFIVAALGLAMNGLVLTAVIDCLGVHYLVAQCVATGAVFGLSFSINRAWTF